MNLNLVSILVAAALFASMALFLELGRKLGAGRLETNAEGARAGLGTVEGAVFALMGLLIAFTFSGAAARFDSRRQLIVEEANAVGTAWLRLDLLPASMQGEMRDLLRRYLDARLAVYQKLPDVKAAREELTKANALQGEIWSREAVACRETGNPIAAQLVPALNQMFDVAATRTAAAQIHPPGIIFIMLVVLALMSSLLAGYAMAGSQSRSWIHTIGFAFILSTTVYVILDLEFPRIGFIRIDHSDQVLVDLRATMN
jgi:hypothetical protein